MGHDTLTTGGDVPEPTGRLAPPLGGRRDGVRAFVGLGEGAPARDP